MIQTPCEEIFGHPKGLFSRCLGVGIPTHKVFGRQGKDFMLQATGQAAAFEYISGKENEAQTAVGNPTTSPRPSDRQLAC